MVDNKITGQLMSVGFSEYEARAYAALIRHNPVSAYGLAKASGIPTSKIYEVLAKLSEKGIISTTGEGRKRQYVPLDVDEFIGSFKKRIDSTLSELKRELSTAGTKPTVSYIWNINDYQHLMDKAVRLMLEAKKTLLVSAWREEAAKLEDYLRMAEIRGVKIAVVHFGKALVRIGQIYQHPIEDTLYAEKGGRGFVLVADSREALMGTIQADGTAEGAWSTNRGFVTMGEDYIKHDIYIMKIVKRFDSILRKKFGLRYEHLRDIFMDGEES